MGLWHMQRATWRSLNAAAHCLQVITIDDARARVASAASVGRAQCRSPFINAFNVSLRWQLEVAR